MEQLSKQSLALVWQQLQSADTEPSIQRAAFSVLTAAARTNNAIKGELEAQV